MNIAYLDTLPEVENKYNFDLEEGEKVVYAGTFFQIGDEHGMRVAMEPIVELTNKRLIFHNGAGLWTFGLDEFENFERKDYGKWIFKGYCYKSDLFDPMYYDNDKCKLMGLQYYFNEATAEDEKKFTDIMFHVYQA